MVYSWVFTADHSSFAMFRRMTGLVSLPTHKGIGDLRLACNCGFYYKMVQNWLGLCDKCRITWCDGCISQSEMFSSSVSFCVSAYTIWVKRKEKKIYQDPNDRVLTVLHLTLASTCVLRYNLLRDEKQLVERDRDTSAARLHARC